MRCRRTPGGSRCSACATARAALVLCAAAPISDPETDRLVNHLIHRIEEVSDGRFGCVAGIGPTVTGLSAAWSSHHRAQLACRAAGSVAPGPVVHWSDLGAHGVLLRLPAAELRLDAVPDELQRLLAVDRDRRLAETLRAYLDAGGSGPAASAALHIHRTTLYYRLERITELTGLDLADGRTRLALHARPPASRSHRARLSTTGGNAVLISQPAAVVTGGTHRRSFG